MSTLELDPDRLLRGDDVSCHVAQNLYALVADVPIISPHGHVDPGLLVQDRPFSDPAELFISGDHYITRLLHAMGVSWGAMGVRQRDDTSVVASPRDIWRTFCCHWPDFAGTASAYWIREVLVSLFGVHGTLDAETADDVFDRIAERLTTAAFRPRALFDRFHIDVLATTDDPMSDLAAHTALAADANFRTRVLPTFRPDKYLDPMSPGWCRRIATMAQWHGTPDWSYEGFLEALAARRAYFIEHGAVSADHGVEDALTAEMDDTEAARLFERGLRGVMTSEEAHIFRAHMLLQMAAMSHRDGLVMTLHAGVFRNHDAATFDAYGPDMGADIPVRIDFVRALRPLLNRYGNEPNFHLVLFSVDEATYSREIAPLAGFYRGVYIGAPWWFLDAPFAYARFRAAVTETAGFYRTAGFVDDTRALLSIPARHDMARRLDASFLASLVRAGRLTEKEARKVMVDLVDTQPRKVFKL